MTDIKASWSSSRVGWRPLSKIIQAAEYGKELLGKDMALERDQRDYETVQQEKHELNLRLQVVVENCTLKIILLTCFR